MLGKCVSTWWKLAEVNIALEIDALVLLNIVAKIIYTLITPFHRWHMIVNSSRSITKSSEISQTSLNLQSIPSNLTVFWISFSGLIFPMRECAKKVGAERLTIIVGYVSYNQKPSCQNCECELYQNAVLLCIETVWVSFWFENDDVITGTTHLSLHFLNRAFFIHFCATDRAATSWYAVKYSMCNEIKVAGNVWHNMDVSIVILYDQSAA